MVFSVISKVLPFVLKVKGHEPTGFLTVCLLLLSCCTFNVDVKCENTFECIVANVDPDL